MTRLWLIIFAFLLGAMVFLLQWRVPSSHKYLFRFNPYHLAEVTLVNPEGSFTFQYTDEEWYLTQPEQIRAFQKGVTILISRLLTIEPKRTIDMPPAAALAEYGLETPRITARIRLTDGTEYGIDLGNETPMGGVMYARCLHDPAHLYLVSNLLQHTLGVGLLEWRERRWITAPDVATIQKVGVTLMGDTWALVKRPAGWVLEDAHETRPIDPGVVERLWGAMRQVTYHKILMKDAGGVADGFQYPADLTLTLEGAETRSYTFYFHGAQIYTPTPLTKGRPLKFHTTSVTPLLKHLAALRQIPSLDWWYESLWVRVQAMAPTLVMEQ